MLVAMTTTFTNRRPTLEPAVAPDDEQRRRELAGFLRHRRERINPEEVGLPVGGRRRTPGLRREEVATLAGVGVTWYTWLEQGRAINVSAQVLESLSRTLLFDPHERAHLFTLAGLNGIEETPIPLAAIPALKRVLDQLEPYPAVLFSPRYDMLAFNRAYNEMVGGHLDSLPTQDRNSLWLMFTDPTFQQAHLNCIGARRHMTAAFRAQMAEHLAEPPWRCLVDRLLVASPDFAELWSKHEVVGPVNKTKQILHPRLGRLELDATSLWLDHRLGTRIMAYTPADDESESKLRGTGS